MTEGEEEKASIYRYDDHQNEIERVRKALNHARTDVDTTVYQYDAQGNWIEKRDYENKRLKTVTTRQIEYYAEWCSKSGIKSGSILYAIA